MIRHQIVLRQCESRYMGDSVIIIVLAETRDTIPVYRKNAK
jgi:hypothetical protein